MTNSIDSDVIKKIELNFFNHYPAGFKDKAWLETSKKHNDDAIVAFFQEQMTIANLEIILNSNDYELFFEQLTKILSKSTMVSTFEKIAFRNYIKFNDIYADFLVALLELYQNYNQETFAKFVMVLQAKKFDHPNANPGKWPVITFFTYYFFDFAYPVKPTTVKKVAKGLDWEINYKSTPNFETYQAINQMYDQFKQKSSLLKNKERILAHAVLFIAFD